MSSSRLLAALACLLLTGCGFHLQGAVKMPTGIRTIYIATSDELTPFATELRDAFEDNGLKMAKHAKGADAVVRVGRDSYGRRVLSVSARNTPAEYEVFYEVEYSVERAGVEAVPTQSLELQRTSASTNRCCSRRSTRRRSSATRWRAISRRSCCAKSAHSEGRRRVRGIIGWLSAFIGGFGRLVARRSRRHGDGGRAERHRRWSGPLRGPPLVRRQSEVTRPGGGT